MVLLPQTGTAEVESICQRMRARADSYDSQPIPVSLALGCSTKTQKEEPLVETLKQAEDEMYQRKVVESYSERLGLRDSLQRSVLAKSRETSEHITMMRQLGLRFAQHLGMRAEEQADLDEVLRFHDIGLVTLPESILRKQGPYEDSDWEHMHRHPEAGFRVMRSVGAPYAAAEGVLTHHERWDGNGYPQGLAGGDIPLLGRIAAVLDTYAAAVTDGPLLAGVTPGQARDELKRCAGLQLDPELVREFIYMLNADDAESGHAAR